MGQKLDIEVIINVVYNVRENRGPSWPKARTSLIQNKPG